MELINFLLKYSRRDLAISLIAGIMSGACNAGLLALLNAAIKHGIVNKERSIAFILLCFFLPLSRHISERILNGIGQHSLYTLRMELCRQILATPLRDLERLGPSRLLAVLAEDIPTITGTLLMIPTVCINIAMIVACFIYLAYLSAYLFVGLIGFLILGIFCYQIPVLKARKLFRRSRQRTDHLHNHFRSLLYGIKELKLHESRRADFLDRILQSTAQSIKADNIAGQNIYSAASSGGQTLVFILIGAVFFWVPSFHTLPLAVLTGYSLSLLYLMSPLQSIMNISPALTRANIALKSVTDIGLSLTEHRQEEACTVPISPPWRSLKLQSVVHAYFQESDARPFVLGPLDVSFKPGEIVFIIGGNGTGKTTFAKLLTGLYVPEEGTIFLDDEPIDCEVARSRYRQYFTAVFGDFYLFDEFIGLGQHGTIDETARRYLQKLNLDTCVDIRERTLSTLDLSQGQRKRLALLTAYLEDRPIYLFDEWAADQDPYFKDIFYTQLLPDLRERGKTVFVISHDDHYYFAADRVIKLENGSIVHDAAKEFA